MDMNDLLIRYFGTSDLDAVNTGAMEAGVDRMRVDFGLESDPNRRFALWSLLYMLDAAPDLDAFESEEEREAARNLMDLMDAAKKG